MRCCDRTTCTAWKKPGPLPRSSPGSTLGTSIRCRTGCRLRAVTTRRATARPPPCRAEPRPAAPKLPGVYAWYFDQVPHGVPVEGCHQVAGHVLLYVGIAPKGTKGSATKPSERTLRCRLGDHVAGKAEGSTI